LLFTVAFIFFTTYLRSECTRQIKLTLYPVRAFIDGASMDNMYLCPSTIQEMLRKRIPMRHVRVSGEDLVFSKFLPLVYSENEMSICFLGAETAVVAAC
jgi:hypothetical protein